MIIESTDGERIDHAWLDAGLIDPAYRGTRCRLVVGANGGIVCDRIEAHRQYDQEGVSRLAEHAVVMTDPSDPDALAVVDEQGRPASLVNQDLVEGVDRRIIRRHASEIEVPAPSKSLWSNLPSIVAAALAVVVGIVATVSSLDRFAEMPMLPFVMAGTHIVIFWLAVSTIRTRARRHLQRLTAWSRLAREVERRRTVPVLVVGDAS